MVDYKSYYKIIEYLDRNELEELKLYLEEEKEEYYLKTAREMLTKYLKSKQQLVTYGFLSNGKLAIYNTISTYLFNEKTILTKARLERISFQVNIGDEIERLYNRIVNQPMIEVERIETERIFNSTKDLIKLYAKLPKPHIDEIISQSSELIIKNSKYTLRLPYGPISILKEETPAFIKSGKNSKEHKSLGLNKYPLSTICSEEEYLSFATNS